MENSFCSWALRYNRPIVRAKIRSRPRVSTVRDHLEFKELNILWSNGYERKVGLCKRNHLLVFLGLTLGLDRLWPIFGFGILIRQLAAGSWPSKAGTQMTTLLLPHLFSLFDPEIGRGFLTTTKFLYNGRELFLGFCIRISVVRQDECLTRDAELHIGLRRPHARFTVWIGFEMLELLHADVSRQPED